MDSQVHNHSNTPTESWFKSHRILGYAALVVIGYYLLTEHRAHVFAFLPYLFLAACPLMHLFMHGGHGQHKKTTENLS